MFYRIVIFILLRGFYDQNLNKSYTSYFIDSKFITFVSGDVKIYEKIQKREFIHIHKYNNKNRCSYHASTYVVKTGDTLFYIAWISGNDYMHLARMNNIKNIHLLKVGQVLKINSTNRMYLNSGKFLKIIVNSVNNCSFLFKRMFFSVKKKFLFIYSHKNIMSNIDSFYNKNFYQKIPVINVYNSWHWPTIGKIINTFSESEGGNKGIDISGSFGQPILAATNGKVVYIGNVLKGYGNLIIIEHDDNYLSAYAHNDMILVVEQQKVKIGDKIATMGNSGTNEIKLHFEIRHKGKSVNPLYYLSKN